MTPQRATAPTGPRRLVDTMRAAGIELEPHGQIYWALCPFHDDSRPSLHVDPNRGDGGSFHCYACGVGGYEPNFRRLMNERQGGAIVRPLPVRRTVRCKPPERAASKAESVLLDRALALWQEAAAQDARSGLAVTLYLVNRGFSLPSIRWHKLAAGGPGGISQRLLSEGFARSTLIRVGLVGRTGKSERFRNRLIIPEFRHGHAVHMTGRRLDGKDEMRYLDLNFDPLLWHLGCALRKPGPIYVVEGQLDAIACCQAGIAAVAFGSTHVSRRQLRELEWIRRQCGRDLIAWGDADQGGAILNRTVHSLGATYQVAPAGKDAAELLRDGTFAAVRRAATRLLRFDDAVSEEIDPFDLLA